MVQLGAPSAVRAQTTSQVSRNAWLTLNTLAQVETDHEIVTDHEILSGCCWNGIGLSTTFWHWNGMGLSTTFRR